MEKKESNSLQQLNVKLDNQVRHFHGAEPSDFQLKIHNNQWQITVTRVQFTCSPYSM